MGFMARVKNDYSISPRAIASNEYCAITIGAEGLARAWGEYDANDPTFADDFVYFLQENPSNSAGPEIILEDTPLTWDRGQEAVKVYKVPATITGENYFDLNDWTTGQGGFWQNWWVNDAELFMAASEPLSIFESSRETVNIYPNPARDLLYIDLDIPKIWNYSIFDSTGKPLQKGILKNSVSIDISGFERGIYLLQVQGEEQHFSATFVKID